MAGLINAARIRELIDDFGAEDFADVVEVFLEEVDQVIDRLSGGDRSQLAADMHFLKGSALNLGLDPFADLCARLEEAEGSVEQADLVELLGLYRRSRAEFTAMVCPD